MEVWRNTRQGCKEKQTNKNTIMEAILKLRAIESWCNWMSEDFNFKVRSLSDFEKLYDFCQKSNIYEFADQIPQSELKAILGYDVI